MYEQIEKPKESKSRAVSNSFAQKQRSGKSTFQFVDNRSEAIAQRKLQKMANDSTKTIQNKKGKKKGASIGKAMRKSGAANVISSMFTEQHMGNYKTAKKMAEQRAGTIPGSCHVISIDELSRIYAEINNREVAGYHAIVGNRIVNPMTGNNQFVTANSYKIFEFSYDKKNRVKKGREINKQFFYDAIPNGAGGFILHHFDGVV